MFTTINYLSFKSVTVTLICNLFARLCSAGGRVRCFECNSHTDPTCGDPFNWSLPLPPVNVCEGCCVKMVQGIGTRKYRIRLNVEESERFIS